MTTNNHPITPPPELVQQWVDRPLPTKKILVIASQWGADQELEACCDVMRANQAYVSDGVLRAIRRPKPPSLKEQALHILDTHGDLTCAEANIIRRALEATND